MTSKRKKKTGKKRGPTAAEAAELELRDLVRRTALLLDDDGPLIAHEKAELESDGSLPLARLIAQASGGKLSLAAALMVAQVTRLPKAKARRRR